MPNSIKEIYSIENSNDLKEALFQFEIELNEKIKPLTDMLNKNLLSIDVSSMEQHLSFVEAWRYKIVNYLHFAAAFVEHAKDSTFIVSKFDGEDGKKLTEFEREAFRRKMAGGFIALQIKLEGIIDSIDSRVNLAKKFLGVEADAPKKRHVS